MIQYLPIAALRQNTGQIEGLPANPRQWTQTDINRLAKSLEETPELFEARPLIVYPQGSEYVILGGNLRYEGAKKNKMQDVPVHILEEGLSIDKLKEIVIKDNGSFGEWDYDAIANEWDDLPLSDWGLPSWSVPKGEINVDEFFESANAVKQQQQSNDLVIEVVIPMEEADLAEEIEELLKESLIAYPNIKVQR